MHSRDSTAQTPHSTDTTQHRHHTAQTPHSTDCTAETALHSRDTTAQQRQHSTDSTQHRQSHSWPGTARSGWASLPVRQLPWLGGPAVAAAATAGAAELISTGSEDRETGPAPARLQHSHSRPLRQAASSGEAACCPARQRGRADVVAVQTHHSREHRQQRHHKQHRQQKYLIASRPRPRAAGCRQAALASQLQ